MIGSVSGGSSNWISHSSGTLTLNSFTMQVRSRFNSGYTLVSVTSSGTLTLNGMIFNCNASYSTYNKALISVNSGSLILSGTNTFTDIKEESGNGGVFEFSSMSSGQSISGATFRSCSSENGGAISVTLTSGYKLSLPQCMVEDCTSMEGVYSLHPLSPSLLSPSHRVQQ